MSKQRPAKISLAACEPCRRTYDVKPGGVTCEACGRPCVQAVVILARTDSPLALLEQASALMLDVLARMRTAAPTS